MKTAALKPRMAIAAAMVYVLSFSDCSIETSGLAGPPPVDMDFEGCFQVELDHTRFIILLPHDEARLSGRAVELLTPGAWAFSGLIVSVSPSIADLNATRERSGEEFTVRAIRTGRRPADTLDLVLTSVPGSGRFDPSVTGLVRCRP